MDTQAPKFGDSLRIQEVFLLALEHGTASLAILGFRTEGQASHSGRFHAYSYHAWIVPDPCVCDWPSGKLQESATCTESMKRKEWAI